jgi:hypothetical protein
MRGRFYMAGSAVARLQPQLVGGDDGRQHILGGDLERHVVDGLPSAVEALATSIRRAISSSLTPIICRLVGRPIERQKPSTVSISAIGAFSSTSCQGTERHFLTVIEVMTLGQLGQAVVNGGRRPDRCSRSRYRSDRCWPR